MCYRRTFTPQTIFALQITGQSGITRLLPRFNERADALANKGMDERGVAHECL